MENKILYIKIELNTVVHNKKVFLSDVAKLYSQEPGLAKKLGKICILTIEDNEDKKFSFSIMKIIDIISKQISNITVINLGEQDFLVSYELPKPKKKWLKLMKVILVSFIVFFGGAFTIMTFNEDVSVGTVFEMVYKIFRAKSLEKYMVMEISYSVGLFIGIVVFFNHFSQKKAHVDPTPLQIEMKSYEKDMNSTIIVNQNREGKTYDI